jgi:NYN domain-containing protein
MRRERDNSEDVARVRVFIDHWEFSLSWQIAYSGFTRRKLTAADLENAQTKAQEVRWALLPDIILEHLDELEYIGDDVKELRNVDVYASARKSGNQRVDNEFIEWLEGTLDPLPGFQVHHFPRKTGKSSIQCGTCGASLERPELQKGLKTKMACDLLSYAVEDLYDIAVLFADDSELAPSILCVQEIFDKKVIHIGLTGRGQALRSAAWGHILLNELMKDLFVPDDFGKKRKH